MGPWGWAWRWGLEVVNAVRVVGLVGRMVGAAHLSQGRVDRAHAQPLPPAAEGALHPRDLRGVKAGRETRGTRRERRRHLRGVEVIVWTGRDEQGHHLRVGVDHDALLRREAGEAVEAGAEGLNFLEVVGEVRGNVRPEHELLEAADDMLLEHRPMRDGGPRRVRRGGVLDDGVAVGDAGRGLGSERAHLLRVPQDSVFVRAEVPDWGRHFREGADADLSPNADSTRVIS